MLKIQLSENKILMSYVLKVVLSEIFEYKRESSRKGHL